MGCGLAERGPMGYGWHKKPTSTCRVTWKQESNYHAGIEKYTIHPMHDIPYRRLRTKNIWCVVAPPYCHL